MQRHEAGDNAATAIHLRLRFLGGALLAAHLLLVGWLTLRPLDVPWAAAANLTPLEGIRADLSYGPLEAARRIGGGSPCWHRSGCCCRWPHGRLARSPLAAWSSLARAGAAAALISLSIAMLQSGVPGQVVDVDSVLLNTAGVLLVHAAVVLALRARLRRSQGPTPRITRVDVSPWTEVLSAVPREY